MHQKSQSQTNHKRTQTILLMAALLLCGFMGMFSETALNIALKGLMEEFSVSAATIQWLMTSYLLVLGIVIPISGLFIKRFKTKHLFTVSLFLSITGLLIEATSASFFSLLIGRIIQAAGTGLLTPLLFNTVLVIFPLQKRGTAMGIVGLVLMFAPAIGPAISGFIIQNLDWHWIFWIPIPFYLLAFILGQFYLIDLSSTNKPRIDMLSILLSAAGFSGLVYGFSRAGEDTAGWSDTAVTLPLAVGVISLLLFIWRQLSMNEPILNVRVFKQPMFIMGIGLTVLSNVIIFSSTIMLPLFMQGVLELSAAKAGLLLLPGGIINGIMSLVNGRIFDKHGPRPLVIPGFMLGAISVLVFSFLSESVNLLTIVIFQMLLMVGMSMTTTPSQTNGLNQLERAMYPDGSAIVNTTIQTSGAIGTAIAVSILNAGQQSILSAAGTPAGSEVLRAALTYGIQQAYTFAFVVAVTAFLCSLFIKRVQAGQSREVEKNKMRTKLLDF